MQLGPRAAGKVPPPSKEVPKEVPPEEIPTIEEKPEEEIDVKDIPF